MDKYEILEEKLKNIKEYIKDMKINGDATKRYLIQYEDNIDKLIVATHNKTIRSSNGALLGLIRGISEYEELCSNDKLWSLAQEADNYYSKECKLF